MLRSFRQPNSRTNRNHFSSILTSSTFTQHSNFSSDSPPGFGRGRGRGGDGTVSLDGKIFSLSEKLWAKEVEKSKSQRPRESSPKNVNFDPAQFDDALEDRKHFQSIFEPIKEPYRQELRERQRQGREQRHLSNIRQKGNVLNSSYAGDRSRNAKDNFKRRAQVEQSKKQQLKDFVAEDIDWNDFTTSQINSLNDLPKNQKDEEAARIIESREGDYRRYLPVSNYTRTIVHQSEGTEETIMSLKNPNDQILDQMDVVKIMIGQNPSYSLSNKLSFYKTLTETLKPLERKKVTT
ncbi:16121_t:CDS:1 [Acaulospora morrowiae]|uniref:16121_t:CDS:1 n=1 Tax=Acaulospora morrowiae TaxID=94023 RepID=A0A9N9CL28_9GLOM|nr:16121_t:CDS:1 [Acaulospora morrowiae]